MIHTVLYSGLCNFVEGDAFGLLNRNTENVGKVPGDGLSLPVRVGGKEDLGGVFGLLFEVLDGIAFAADIDIMCFKVIFDIHSKCAFRQVTHVADRCNHFVVGTEIAFDRQGLGG